MKKLLKISLLPFMALSVVGCTTKIKPSDLINGSVKEKKLYENDHIKKILDSIYKDNKDLEKRYINTQEHRFRSAYTDLRYSLTVYPIFIGHYVTEDVEKQYRDVVNKAKKLIENNLSSNWYWTLNNIDKFVFNFNPYGDFYRANAVDQQLFKLNDQANSTLVSIDNKFPTGMITFKNKTLEVDKLKEFKTFYLIYDNYKVLKMIQYKEDEKLITRILPDLLIFKDKNITKDEIKPNLEKIEKETFNIRKQKLDDYLEDKKDKYENADIYQMKSDFSSSHRNIWINDWRVRNKFRSYDLKQTKLAESLFENLKQDRTKVDQYIGDWKNRLEEAYEQDVINSQPYTEHKQLLDEYKEKLDQLVNTTIEKIQKWSKEPPKQFGKNERQTALQQYEDTDKQFFEFQAKRQYSNALFDSINKINQIDINKIIEDKDLDKVKIFRFSMRYIYENK
ncbi:Hypothetical protein, predicted lipoprotein [Mycoplasma yeatsii 13926]|uniref:Lipoprotein n=1 Tax=Mycoplasma yeatsii 13926 TaxID=1188240 RepID=S6G893_9MOLU|nr:aromatic motif membrane protein [Mycoplasma yeatsii]EOA07304.1 Hypothetical protein, predicted lipoprotein [Mycoplasma yeatsii 13926]